MAGYLTLPLIVGAAYLIAIWLATDSRATRRCALLAVVGCVILYLGFGFFSLCGIAENRSELFNERCQGGTPRTPLLGIPLLLAAPLLRRYVRGQILLTIGVAVAAILLTVPWMLLDV